MDVIGALLRASDGEGNIYSPYYFEGSFSDDEISIIEGSIKKYVPEKVSATFNNWSFVKSRFGKIYVRKASWDDSIVLENAEAVSKKIENYFGK